ncbi:hypothetical protein FQA39_LY14405 [Lamprigera yunnana]|nr:hypothetical protein FQA39_LY14405 [Lamprigera yunnana]
MAFILAQLDTLHKGTFNTEPETMAYMECILRTGQILKDGKLNYDSLTSQLANLPPSMSESALKTAENCKSAVKSGDKFMAAFEFYKCFYEDNPSMSEKQLKAGTKLIRNVCQSKHKLTDVQIDAMHSGEFIEDSAHMMKDNRYDLVSAQKQIPNLPEGRRETAQKTSDSCKDSATEDDKCKAAFQIYICMYNDNPEPQLIPAMVLSTTMESQSEAFDHLRKFMNGAVYIESSPYENAPVIRSSCTKRISCTCSREQLCKIHKQLGTERKVSGCLEFSSTSEVSACDENEMRESTNRTNDTKESRILLSPSTNDVDRDTNFEIWMAKKREDKKRLLQTQQMILEHKEREKQKRLEEERENFKRWLANKKKQEEENAKQEKMKLAKQKNDEEKKKRRSKESELKYKLWYKRKEQLQLESKLKEKIDELKIAEEKERRLEENKTAYENWKKLSVNKPTPIPLGKGLETLRSSVSVTFINPTPWQPNIDTIELNP